MRRDFVLPEMDVDFLDASGYIWETIQEEPFKWLIIHNYPVPAGYNVQNVNVALYIESNYPLAQIDMAYFMPHLVRISGHSIGALASQSICGQDWQRWSRHRTAENPWRPGLDDISTHLQLVTNWMERELRK
jgi:hypothetical protein